MTDVQLAQVFAVMKEKGFHAQPKGQKRPSPAAKKARYLAKITALLAENKLPQSYADGIARQSYGVQFVHWLDVPRLQKVK
ncbi:phage protein GemA/Gp16 family protein [Chelonobacter oris]|uniref:phage protein GemA/Gp16 family protein n=1 Tax=Chelonobacter oris TaxID=505317 RepID=UPI0024481C0F|nr:phage protein GemA/Gp16 family protein [Chelonobacter oris]